MLGCRIWASTSRTIKVFALTPIVVHEHGLPCLLLLEGVSCLQHLPSSSCCGLTCTTVHVKRKSLRGLHGHGCAVSQAGTVHEPVAAGAWLHSDQTSIRAALGSIDSTSSGGATSVEQIWKSRSPLQR